MRYHQVSTQVWKLLSDWLSNRKFSRSKFPWLDNYLKAFIIPYWSFVVYERTILGESPKPHFPAFTWNLADFTEIQWISCLKTFKPDNSREKLHFHRVQWEAVSFEIMWNPLDFMNYGRFHLKFSRFYEIHRDFVMKDHLPGMVKSVFQWTVCASMNTNCRAWCECNSTLQIRKGCLKYLHLI